MVFNLSDRNGLNDGLNLLLDVVGRVENDLAISVAVVGIDHGIERKWIDDAQRLNSADGKSAAFDGPLE